MRYQEKIYNQNNKFVKNSDLLNINMSSDICIFEAPTYDISGATKILSGTTSATTGVYLVDDVDIGTFDLMLNFTSNITQLNVETKFKYEIYEYNGLTFNLMPTITSEDIEYNTFSGTSAITITIDNNKLNIDGEYLIKGYYKHKVCTNILNNLNIINDTSINKNGLLYGLYEPSIDYYFNISQKADKPKLTATISSDSRQLGSLVAFSTILNFDGEIKQIKSNTEGDLLIYLNGLLLSNTLDYNIVGTDIIMIGNTYAGDIITYVSVSNNKTNGLVVDNIIIDTTPPNGIVDNQGDNKFYYNSTNNKFEIYTELTPLNGNDLVVTLNGVTLAPNIDYYQSISNSKRIILSGNLLVGDIVNIIYNSYPTYVGEIYVNNPIISWYINAPSKNNGKFTLELSSDKNFNTIISTNIVGYKINTPNYSSEIIINGNVGTKYYYRVLNEKNFKTISGDIITTKKYSDTVPIIIMTNNINSY